MRINKIWAYRNRLCGRSRVVQRTNYQGFRIDILDNGARSFKFEYVVSPLSPTSKALISRALRHSKENGIYDPTSHRLFVMALGSAQVRVNEIRSPFWLKDWKY